jgi:predicted nucleotidyltransferase
MPVSVFENPHSTADHQRVGEGGEILRVLVGSGVHGTAVDGQDDRDEMGICIEPPEYVCGLEAFEQYIFRTQPEGHRSGPGVDLTIYSVRKWMRLAVQGNPTVLLPLFVSDSDVIVRTELGDELRALAPSILSRRAGERFQGYLSAQRDRLLGARGGKHTNRPELIEIYGYDTKYAMHMVRLGVQGVELLETGTISLPIREPWLTWLRDLRHGRHSRTEALEAAGELEARIVALLDTSPLPAEPDMAAVNRWLVSAHRRAWSTVGDTEPGKSVPM